MHCAGVYQHSVVPTYRQCVCMDIYLLCSNFENRYHCLALYQLMEVEGGEDVGVGVSLSV